MVVLGLVLRACLDQAAWGADHLFYLKAKAFGLSWSAWKFLLRFNFTLGLCVIFDFINRVLKLLYALYIRKAPIVEIHPPGFETDGTFINSAAFLIQALSFLILYKTLKLISLCTVPEDVAFHLLWTSRSVTWADYLRNLFKTLVNYLKTMLLWFISGIPPRFVSVLKIWIERVYGSRGGLVLPIHIPYLEALHNSIRDFRIFFVHGTIQLNPKDTVLKRCKTVFDAEKTLYLMNKLDVDLKGIQNENSPTVEANFEEPGYTDEVKTVAKAVEAARPQRWLFSKQSGWYCFDSDYRADVLSIVQNIRSKTSLKDYIKFEAEALQSYNEQLDAGLKTLSSQKPGLPEEVQFGLLKTLNSPSRHPTFRYLLKAQYRGGELPFDLGYTSNMLGIWKAYDEGKVDLLTHIPLGEITALTLPGAVAPGSYAYSQQNLFKPGLALERGSWRTRPSLEERVRSSDIVNEVTDSLILTQNRALAHSILNQEELSMKLVFRNPELADFHTTVEGVLADVDISKMQKLADLPEQLIRAQLNIARVSDGRGLLVGPREALFWERDNRIAEFL